MTIHHEPTMPTGIYVFEADPPALDVERLVRVLWNGVIPARHWLDSETTTENFARWVIAEYARLAREEKE